MTLTSVVMLSCIMQSGVMLRALILKDVAQLCVSTFWGLLENID
jgi:hypothetical protein